MTVKPNKLFNLAAFFPIIVGAASALFMGFVFWWPPKAAYEVSKPNDHYVTYVDGQIRTHRAYCINYDVPITVSRDMIRIGAPGEAELRISLPQTVQTYELGCHYIDRIFEVPRGTPSGNYRLRFTASWQANPFRDQSVALPELMIAIPKQK